MKPSVLFLIASLAANAVLLAFLARSPATPPAPSAVAVPSAPRSIDFAATLDPQLWPALATTDLPALLTRLREAGFPVSLIRTILSAQLDEQFAARRETIAGPELDLPRWKVALAEADPVRRRALEDLELEKSALLKRLLGADAVESSPTTLALRQARFGWLPPEKAAALTGLERDYHELRGEAYRAGSEPARIAKLAELEKAERTDFARLLTPQELADYDLRNSPSARLLRYTLVHFDPTETEYRTLHALRQPFDDRFAPGLDDPAQAAAKAEAEKNLNAQIKAALGDARYADYLHSADENYGSISILVSRLALPATATVQIYDLQKNAQTAAAAIQADPALTPEVRAARLAALATQTTAALTASLGPSGFEAYLKAPGRWLQKIQPPTPATPGGG